VRQLASSSWLDRLSALEIADNELGDLGLGFLAGARCLNRLRLLDARGNNVGPSGARALASSAYLTRLSRLDLGENRLGAEGADELTSSSNASDLLELGLQNNHLRDDGAWVLAGRRGWRNSRSSVWRTTPSPRTERRRWPRRRISAGWRCLDLSGNRIGDAGALALAASPLARLRRLDVRGNPITEPRRQALRTRFGRRCGCESGSDRKRESASEETATLTACGFALPHFHSPSLSFDSRTRPTRGRLQLQQRRQHPEPRLETAAASRRLGSSRPACSRRVCQSSRRTASSSPERASRSRTSRSMRSAIEPAAAAAGGQVSVHASMLRGRRESQHRTSYFGATSAAACRDSKRTRRAAPLRPATATATSPTAPSTSRIDGPRRTVAASPPG